MEDSVLTPFLESLPPSFPDSQKDHAKVLFSHMQTISEFTLDCKKLQDSLKLTQKAQIDNYQVCLQFITAFMSTRGVFPRLKVLKVQSIIDSVPLIECIKQLQMLTELDLSECHLSVEMQEDLQLWPLTEMRILKLKNTHLNQLPPSVGRLHNLEHLDLSHNNLSSLPITLTFCRNLEHLDLSYNNFDAIPGVVLDLKKLKSLRRLNNTRLIQRWDGLDAFPHISVATSVPEVMKNEPDSLQAQAARSIMALHVDYWTVGSLPSLQCKLLDAYASKYNYCQHCHKATTDGELIITVMRPLFADLRDVPFKVYSCKSCSDTIKELLTDKQAKLNQRMEEDHAVRMKEAMKREGIKLRKPYVRETNDKTCLVM